MTQREVIIQAMHFWEAMRDTFESRPDLWRKYAYGEISSGRTPDETWNEFRKTGQPIFWTHDMWETATRGVAEMQGITCRAFERPIPPMCWIWETLEDVGDFKETQCMWIYQEGIKIHAGLVKINREEGRVLFWQTDFSEGMALHDMWHLMAYAAARFLHLPIIRQSEEQLPRKVAKRLRRQGQQVPSPIRIVEFRIPAEADPPRGRDGEQPAVQDGDKRQYRCSWMVRGHWRKQWYPSIKGHDIIWIDSYVKGDLAKPLKSASSVTAYKVTRPRGPQASEE